MQSPTEVIPSHVRRLGDGNGDLRRDSLAENSLSDLALEVESDNVRLQHQLTALAEGLKQNQTERLRLDAQLRDINAATRRLALRWTDVERRNNTLSSLYVAVSQLHCRLTHAEVLEALSEIIIGLIGCEELAVFGRVDGGETFRLLTSYGIDAEAYSEVTTDQPLARLFAAGEIYVDGDRNEMAVDLDRPIAAVVPLLLDGRVTGGIVMLSFLSQKRELLDADYELFELLSTHAAIALYFASLHDLVKGEAAS
jgi:GAF domain-containing protein